jgi:flagellar biosynthesis protein FlhG
MVKLLRLQGAQVVPWVIVNMAENRVKGRKVFDQFALACNEYLGFRPRFAGAICRDPRVPDSIRAQTPLPLRHPQSQAYEDVIRIVETLNAN